MVSKGFLVLAQNTDDVDYVKQAYALALSIKFSQTTVTSISLVTNNIVPAEYLEVFDNVIPIPWYKEGTRYQAENRWKLYHVTPYAETIVLDTDMLLLEDISEWWNYCGNHNLKFCSKIKNHKKAMDVLMMIAECERRLSSYQISATAFGIDWYLERIEINIKIKERLINYYNTRWK